MNSTTEFSQLLKRDQSSSPYKYD